MEKQDIEYKIYDSTPKRLVYSVSVQYLLARAIHVATEFNLGKFILDSPTSFDEIKKNFDDVNHKYFFRLLKFLAHHGVCVVNEKNEVIATEMTQYLVSDDEGNNLIVSNEDWCAQGDLLKYLDSHSDEVQLLLNKNIEVAVNKNTITVSADPADMVYLYSRLHLISRALHIIAQLNIVKYINSDQLLDVDNFVRENDFEEVELSYLMKLLALLKLVEPVKETWVISDVLFRTLGNAEETIRPAFCMVDDAWWNSVSELKYSISTGNIAFEKANGKSFFKYLEDDQQFQKKFNEGLGCFSKEDDMDVIEGMDFSAYKSVVDIGGGYGGLLHHLFQNHSAVLQEIILFEQPHVLNNVHPDLTKDKTDQKYFPVGGDLFKPEDENNLPLNKDLYIIKGVLHDFDDEKVKLTLSNIQVAMSDDSELLVVERSLRSDNSLNINYSSDILMLVLLDGRERSMDDWLMLFRYSGLVCENSQNAPIAGDFSLMRCKKYQPSIILALNDQARKQSDSEESEISEVNTHN